MARPIIKYAGGKDRLWPQLSELMPKTFSRYFEPFLGGGAVFFRLMEQGFSGEAFLGDINQSLIEMYEEVRDDVDDVIEVLKQLEQDHSKETYYAARDVYNGSGEVSRAERAALFVYLNKTGFNGLYRVNTKNLFNTPWGKKKTFVCDEPALRAASAVLQKASLTYGAFEDTISSAQPGDFVYLDPPYMPTSDTANFTMYASGGFGVEQQRFLADVCQLLDDGGVKFMLSNSDTLLTCELYSKWNITKVLAKRSVSGKGSGRASVLELVVRNYDE